MLLLVGGFDGLVGGLAWGSRGWPLVHDAPIMHYIAWRIGEGAAPYRDLFDMNFPGTYLLHLAVLRLLGPGDVAWRVFDLAWLAAGAAAVATYAAPWGWIAAAGGSLFFAAYHLAAGPWNAGQRDVLLCPLLMLGALGVVRWVEARAEPIERAAWAASTGRSARSFGDAQAWNVRAIRPLIWGGLALGASITIKPHALLFVVALGVLVAVVSWRSGRIGPAAVFAGAVAVAPVAVAAWVAALGALPAWRAVVFDYLIPLYSRLGRPPQWGFHRWQVLIPVAVGVAISTGSAIVHARLGARHVVALGGLAYGIAHYVVQGKGWEYHLYPAAVFAAPLLVCELEPLLRARRPVAGVALAASLVVTALMLGPKGAEAAAAAHDGWIAAKEHRVSAIVADLRGRLAPGDLVQVLDTTGGGIHALLRLHVEQPTRFVYDFHFFHDTGTPTIRALRAEFLRDLEARPPRCVVIFRDGWPTGGYERIEAFPELARWLARGFRLATKGDGYVIYAKRDDS